MTKRFIIYSILALLAVFTLGVYLFTRGSPADDLIQEQGRLHGRISGAEGRLKKEKETLASLLQGLYNSYPLASSMQEQMRQASDLVNKTDFMFANADGLTPELLVENILNGELINSQRQDINLLIQEWQRKTDISSIDDISVEESEKIKQEAEMIKEFIETLLAMVGNLTPQNSGLSQFQIDNYVSQLPSVESINEVLVSIGVAIEDYTTNIAQNPNATSPSVTPGDVIAQENVVAGIQAELATIQQQLAQVEEQLQQISPTPTPTPVPTPIPTPTPTPITTDPIDPSVYGVQHFQNVINSGPRVIPHDEGIIIQPGPPRLIQGTDPY